MDALINEGNNVLLFKSNDLCDNFQFSNELLPELDRKEITDRIAEFKPDLIVSFNHSGLYPGLVDTFGCPVAIWLLDGPAYIVEPDQFRAYASRYQVFSPVKVFAKDLEEDFGVPQSNIHDLPFCSDLVAQPLNRKQEIVFVGTFFHPGKAFLERLRDFCQIKALWAQAPTVISFLQHRPRPYLV